jgi:hypothetical protein
MIPLLLNSVDSKHIHRADPSTHWQGKPGSTSRVRWTLCRSCNVGLVTHPPFLNRKIQWRGMRSLSNRPFFERVMIKAWEISMMQRNAKYVWKSERVSKGLSPWVKPHGGCQRKVSESWWQRRVPSLFDWGFGKPKLSFGEAPDKRMFGNLRLFFRVAVAF